MKIHLIWAQEKDGGIGINNDLPWHISEDLKNFKKLTLNTPIIMGRKTWESLPFKPLPKRRNVVLSSQSMDGVECYTSVDDCRFALADESDIFVIGGAQIYKAFYAHAHHLHITMIDEKTAEIDTYFPIPLSEIETSFVQKTSEALTNNAQYTYWTKTT
ncbi:MAG: dihydrofolate reductase [Candidatus Marinimicrobia bacterium]|nr:dihydrofolate reductase [Candidatus Neomarinimicrobiota bacterium]